MDVSVCKESIWLTVNPPTSSHYWSEEDCPSIWNIVALLLPFMSQVKIQHLFIYLFFCISFLLPPFKGTLCEKRFESLCQKCNKIVMAWISPQSYKASLPMCAWYKFPGINWSVNSAELNQGAYPVNMLYEWALNFSFITFEEVKSKGIHLFIWKRSNLFRGFSCNQMYSVCKFGCCHHMYWQWIIKQLMEIYICYHQGQCDCITAIKTANNFMPADSRKGRRLFRTSSKTGSDRK